MALKQAACVATGHPVTTAAAVDILEAGGNAYDAAVAAGFAASAAEPTLTSLAGGGFLLAATNDGEEVVFDFFVDTPGLGRSDTEPHFIPVTISFPSSTQDFNVGWGSAAVPGTLAGLLHVHRRLGRLPLAEVVAPAVAAARFGVVLDQSQASLVSLLAPILTCTPESAAVFAPGALLREGDRITNALLADFIDAVGAGTVSSFADDAIATALVRASDANEGLLTAEDLDRYRVVEREPLEVAFRGRRVLTNPPPSFGGPLLGEALVLLDAREQHGTAATILDQVDVMAAIERSRDGRESTDRPRQVRGTTHVSVSDFDGNVASLTMSNGEGAGCFVPGTGVMLNNMLGEDDLHPDGFHTAPAGLRVSSMMSPSVVIGPGGPELVLGSGGSKRIRSAILQVTAAATASDRPLAACVDAPRVHWDDGVLQIEPGLEADDEARLRTMATVNRWDAPNLYFGGVHVVRPGSEASADHRRGGAARVISRAH